MSAATAPVVTFGEVLLRLSPPERERLFQSPSLRTWWGGAEANVAAGLANLGTASQHITILPEGPIGDAAVRALGAEGVDTRHVRRRGARMGLYFLEGGADLRPLRVVYDRAHSAFSQLAPTDFDWASILSGARWLHLTGISPALGDAPLRCVHDALDAAEAHRVPVSLDLNYRPALWAGRDPRAIMQPLAARATCLIANPGAIEVMLGHTTAGNAPEAPEAIRATAEALHREYGCARVATTQREILSASVHGWQAHLWDAATNAMHYGGRYEVQLVDRVGGGDAFVAGLLHQLLADAPLDYAVRFATAASALKLTIPGDINRVRVADVEQLLSPAT
ncbi:PfkB family carbohydrate kinase [Gemmatimonas sp.]|uniref:PfkB family carbohydrate kinase n=1 Tax=Gemmatimonas sp. TaxID=1962908 RepID=UPI003566FD6B